MVLYAIEPIGGQTARIAESDTDPFERLEQIIELTFGLFHDDWDLYCVALLLGDSIQERIKSRFHTATRAIRRVVECGQRYDLLQGGNAQLLAIQCHGLIMRMARARVFGEVESPLRQYTVAVAESTRRILAPANPKE